MFESLDESVLELRGVENSNKNTDTLYEYNGTKVPRVSRILDTCFDKSSIIYWASSVSKQEYESCRKTACTVGIYVHEYIEGYLDNKEEPNFNDIFIKEHRELARTAFFNFVGWHNRFTNIGFKINPLFIEQQITTPWYGGTIDCIAEIIFPNGYTENVIVDFKTSRTITSEYIMQTFAYMWAVNWNRVNNRATLPQISGTMIIRVDKSNNTYNWTYLNLTNNFYTFIELEKDLTNMVNWYYSQMNLAVILKEAKRTAKKLMEVDYGKFGRDDPVRALDED